MKKIELKEKKFEQESKVDEKKAAPMEWYVVDLFDSDESPLTVQSTPLCTQCFDEHYILISILSRGTVGPETPEIFGISRTSEEEELYRRLMAEFHEAPIYEIEISSKKIGNINKEGRFQEE